MKELFGIPLAIDLGTFVGLMATGLTAAGITRWLSQRLNRERLELERTRVASEEAYRVHKEALAIHESLTSREVFAAVQQVRTTGESPEDHAFLVATYKRGQSRYLAFKDSVELAPPLESLVNDAITTIASMFPAELKREQRAFVQKQQARTNDRTKFLVDGKGPFSKHHTLHLIQHRFCELNRVTSRDDFNREFGKVVKQVIGDEVSGIAFTGESLLHDPDAASAAHQKRYREREKRAMEELGPIRLASVDYLGGWNAGFEKDVPDAGRALHKPLIEHFAGVRGYQDIKEA